MTELTIENNNKTKEQKWEEKQLYWYFKWCTGEISHKNTWIWQRKGNLQRETETVLIVVLNNTIRNNCIKARIDNTQQNSKSRLCDDKYEMVNHIISEFSKLTQKECRTMYDWVGKVIHWELCKKFKLDYATKWYMHKPESLGFWDTNRLSNPGQKRRPRDN